MWVGMQVNSDMTSKDKKISQGSRFCSRRGILSAKALLFLTEYLLFWRGEIFGKLVCWRADRAGYGSERNIRLVDFW